MLGKVFNISRVLLHFEHTDEQFSAKVLEKLGGNVEIDFICDHTMNLHLETISSPENYKLMLVLLFSRMIISACESAPF